MQVSDLSRELRRLHLLAGEPSAREISRRTHGMLSHTTVSQTLRGARLPSWRSLEAVVSALDGDVEEFRRLWVDTRQVATDPSVIANLSDGNPPNSSRYALFSGDITSETSTVINYARLLNETEGKKPAIDFLEKWQAKHAANAAILIELVALGEYEAVQTGRYDRIIEALIDDEEEPDTAGSALWIAHQCEKRGLFDRELYFLRCALRMKPRSEWVLYRLGDYFYRKMELDKAVSFFLRSHKAAPSSGNLFLTVNALCMHGMPEMAEQVCRETYEVTKNSDVVDSWTQSLLVQGKRQEAVSLLRSHLEAVPAEREWTLLELARLLAEAGDLAESRKIFTEVLNSSNSSYRTNQAMAGISYIALSEGDRDGARKIMSQIISTE
ncbi:tetratricopeptide repeat protein [Kitasatospora sp. NPDC093558]|uniref:tetratricopeptide repeat protein n=1 Tax=Kitasatospora sp. NPDC093558 TaxID=3155201 RepID=UPI003427137C